MGRSAIGEVRAPMNAVLAASYTRSSVSLCATL